MQHTCIHQHTPTAHSVFSLHQRIKSWLLCSSKQVVWSQRAAENEKYNRRREEEEEEEGGAGRWVGVESSHTAVSRRRRLGGRGAEGLSRRRCFLGISSYIYEMWMTERRQAVECALLCSVTEDIHLAFPQVQFQKWERRWFKSVYLVCDRVKISFIFGGLASSSCCLLYMWTAMVMLEYQGHKIQIWGNQ